jgi:hypothetical protein
MRPALQKPVQRPLHRSASPDSIRPASEIHFRQLRKILPDSLSTYYDAIVAENEHTLTLFSVAN